MGNWGIIIGAYWWEIGKLFLTISCQSVPPSIILDGTLRQEIASYIIEHQLFKEVTSEDKQGYSPFSYGRNMLPPPPGVYTPKLKLEVEHHTKSMPPTVMKMLRGT